MFFLGWLNNHSKKRLCGLLYVGNENVACVAIGEASQKYR